MDRTFGILKRLYEDRGVTFLLAEQTAIGAQLVTQDAVTRPASPGAADVPLCVVGTGRRRCRDRRADRRRTRGLA